MAHTPSTRLIARIAAMASSRAWSLGLEGPRGRREGTRASSTEKKKYSFDLLEEYTRKTDGRRRPMPQQIWKGPEIKIHDAPPRRLTSAAGAHDAWETARPLRHD